MNKKILIVLVVAFLLILNASAKQKIDPIFDEILNAISELQARVTDLENSNIPADQTCDIGDVVIGFDSEGNIICATDIDTQLSEQQVENYVVNGPLNLFAGTTLNGEDISIGTHTTNLDWSNILARPEGLDDGDDDTTYDGNDFALSNQRCSEGDVVTGIDLNGNVICEKPVSNGIPSGFSIMGDTEIPPSGYTYTGDHWRAENLATDWKEKTPMPTARFALTSGVVNNKIFAIGGRLSDGTYFGTNEEYNPVTDTWITKTSMPTPRAHLASGVVGDKIYAIGGLLQDGSYSSANEEYDPVTDTWTTKAPLPMPRDKLTVTTVDGKIYAIGGSPVENADFKNDEYDPVTDTWTAKADLPMAVTGGGAVAVNGEIYVIVYRFDKLRIQEYSPDTDTWEIKMDVPATYRSSFAVASINGKIYVIGGGNAGTNEEYDPTVNTWRTMSAMPTSRGLLTTGVVEDMIYAIGGTSGSANEEYSPPAYYYVHTKD